tara:strand:+ start:902 stop:1690 length:789 start_codon:yes stop_codon:yes gene_type:complete
VPIACSSSALTGQSGSVYYTPAGTEFCLQDFTDFPAGDDITVPAKNDFRVGDPVVFSIEDGAKIDTALTAGTGYFVVARTATTIQVAASKGGTALAMNGDGGTGSADSPGHINISFDPYQAVCDVSEFSIEISREELDTTTLPCGVGAGGGVIAAFRSTQPGYASATGTLSVYFSDNSLSIGQRMLANVLRKDQSGARIRLFNNTVSDGASTPAPDLVNSSYIEGDITLTGVSLSVNPDDPQAAEISFSVQNIGHLFTTSLV